MKEKIFPPCRFRIFNDPACPSPDCPLERKHKGLCKVFEKFVQIHLKDGDELDLEIAESTIETIQREIDNFNGRESNMEGAFFQYCRTIFRRRRSDILRRKQGTFERKRISLETDLGKDGADDGYSLIENTASVDPDFEGSQDLWIDRIDQKRRLEVFDTLILAEDKCAKLLVEWLELDQQGLTEKEIAQTKSIGYDAYRQRLRRCREYLKTAITENLNSSRYEV